MALLSIRGISLGFGGELLLDQVDLNIEVGDRACLIGRNGTGKSSLLKVLHGDVRQDAGEIVASGDVRIAYLPQDVPEGISGSVEDIAGSWIGSDSAGDGVWSKHHVVGKVISHLALDAHAEFNELSGGQKRRVLLARALACEPDLLLLDEPTNHLDIHSICWMEEFLLRHCKTILFVTHDRSFLRRVANRIVDLDRGKLAHWSCDYDTFLQRKADLLNDEEVNRARFDKKLSKEEIWIRQGIKARRTRDEGRVRQLMAMREERRQRRMLEGTARLSVQQAERSGNKVIKTEALHFSYDGVTPVIRDYSTTIMRGDKIGIIGANGSGKTTLLKLLTTELAPTGGEVEQGTKLEIAYFDQHRAVLDNDLTVAENAGRGSDSIKVDGGSRHVISYLADFLFAPDRARSPVRCLSGGERNRLLLAMLFARPSNLLVMDEPTNDLDAETLELLEEQLLNYRGTLLMVSHDRAFLDNVVTRIVALKGNGDVEECIGSYEDYARLEAAALKAEPKAGNKAAAKAAKGNRLGFNEKRELAGLPRRIEQLESEQEALHVAMSSPDYYKKPSVEIAKDRQRSAELVEALEVGYDRWAALEAMRDGG